VECRGLLIGFPSLLFSPLLLPAVLVPPLCFPAVRDPPVSFSAILAPLLVFSILVLSLFISHVDFPHTQYGSHPLLGHHASFN